MKALDMAASPVTTDLPGGEKTSNFVCFPNSWKILMVRVARNLAGNCTSLAFVGE